MELQKIPSGFQSQVREFEWLQLSDCAFKMIEAQCICAACLWSWKFHAHSDPWSLKSRNGKQMTACVCTCSLWCLDVKSNTQIKQTQTYAASDGPPSNGNGKEREHAETCTDSPNRNRRSSGFLRHWRAHELPGATCQWPLRWLFQSWICQWYGGPGVQGTTIITASSRSVCSCFWLFLVVVSSYSKKICSTFCWHQKANQDDRNWNMDLGSPVYDRITDLDWGMYHIYILHYITYLYNSSEHLQNVCQTPVTQIESCPGLPMRSSGISIFGVGSHSKISTTKSCCLARRTFESSSDRNVQIWSNMHAWNVFITTISHKRDQR